MRITFLFFMCLGGYMVFGQGNPTNPVEIARGFALIEKAERKVDKKHYRKANDLLNEAWKIHYGYSNDIEWRDAYRRIYALRARIQMEKGAVELARVHIAEGKFYLGGDEEIFDSLWIRTYQMQYGVDSFRTLFDSTLKCAYIECSDYCYIFMPLKGTKEDFRLPVSHSVQSQILSTDDGYGNISMQPWIDYFQRSKAYQLIYQPWQRE